MLVLEIQCIRHTFWLSNWIKPLKQDPEKWKIQNLGKNKMDFLCMTYVLSPSCFKMLILVPLSLGSRNLWEGNGESSQRTQCFARHLPGVPAVGGSLDSVSWMTTAQTQHLICPPSSTFFILIKSKILQQATKPQPIRHFF